MTLRLQARTTSAFSTEPWPQALDSQNKKRFAERRDGSLLTICVILRKNGLGAVAAFERRLRDATDLQHRRVELRVFRLGLLQGKKIRAGLSEIEEILVSGKCSSAGGVGICPLRGFRLPSARSAEKEQFFESMGKRLPVGRVGEAHDIAQALLFLMQEGFSTGQTVVVDGGTVLV
jgi:hypothetical protein